MDSGDHIILTDKVAQLCEIPEEDWYHRIIQRSNVILTEAEQNHIILGCKDIAQDLAQPYLKGEADPEKTIAALGYSIQYERSMTCLGREILPVFGWCEPQEKQIIINLPMTQKTQKLMESINNMELPSFLRLSAFRVRDVVLWHEIFHILEEKRPGIYTRSKIASKIYFGRFRKDVSLDAASEVGAIHFSKIMTKLPFSPCIIEKLALIALGRITVDRLQV